MLRILLVSAALCVPSYAQEQAVAWGYNNDDQVDGTPLTGGIQVVAAGGFHCLAIQADGSLVAWGWDGYSQVSDAPSGFDFEAIAGGNAHSLALRSDGSLVSWGRDVDPNTGARIGQVSDTPTTSDFQAIACGFDHSLALRLDGSIVSWGLDDFGQVTNTPSGSDFVAIGAGRQHSLALRSDGSIVAWGRDTYGQVSLAPGGTGFIEIDGGYQHSLALDGDGNVYAWGGDGEGQVSGAPTTGSFVDVSAGGLHSLALTSAGELVAWGDDRFQVSSDTPTGDLFTAISGDGAYHGMAMRATPGGYRWFHNPGTGNYYAATVGLFGYLTWAEAQSEAGAIGAYLVSIQDSAEEDFLDGLYGNPGSTAVCDQQYYVGLQRVGGSWQWEDGSPYGGYTNWAPGFPDPTSTENFARKAWHSGASSEWANGDGGCRSLSIFEWEPIYDRDQDDDGILDLEEVPYYQTNPTIFDTDGDGLGDGLEVGVSVGTPDTDLSVFVPDEDPSTTTDPLSVDTDLGGVEDGVEDQNQDGRVDTWETDPNVGADESLAFYVSNLSPGANAHFEVYNATPLQGLFPAYSVAGPGPTALGIGVTVDLSQPINTVTPVLADIDGRASWDGPRVPGGISLGVPVWLQLVEVSFTGSAPRVSNPLLLPVGSN